MSEKEDNAKLLAELDKAGEAFSDEAISNSQIMDKWIMGVNSVTFAGSATALFSDKFSFFGSEFYWLLWSWIFLGTSFISSLTTYIVIVINAQRGIEAVKSQKKLIEKGDVSKGNIEPLIRFHSKRGITIKTINTLNYLAFAACFIGVICLMIFLVSAAVSKKEKSESNLNATQATQSTFNNLEQLYKGRFY